MNYYDPYDQPDPEEERRLQMAAMHSFATRQPIEQTMGLYSPSDQPEPDAERAAAVLEAPSQHSGPTPRELEDDAVRAVRDSYGQKKSFFDQGGGAAIAAGLDVLLNKGRDIGTIVGGYAQGRQRADADDKDSMRQMAKLEIQRAQETQHDKERSEIGEINKGNLAARNAENELARDRFNAQKGDPETDRAYKAALTNEAEARAYGEWTKDPSALTPEQQAVNEDRDAMRTIRKDEIDARGQDRDEARRMRMTQANTQAFNAYRTDKERVEKEDRSATETFNEKTKSTRDLARTIQGAEGVLSKYGEKDDLPGIGKFEGHLPATWHWNDDTREDSIKLDQARRQANQTYKVLKTGLAAPIAEAEDIAMANGFQEGATEQEFRLGMKTLGEVTRREIRTRASASPANAKAALDAEGLGGWTGGWGPDSVKQDYGAFTPPYSEDVINSSGAPAYAGTRQSPLAGVTPDALPPDRISGPGPQYRGTQGFQGSGDPDASNPSRMKALDEDQKRIQRRLQQGGVDFRWED